MLNLNKKILYFSKYSLYDNSYSILPESDIVTNLQKSIKSEKSYKSIIKKIIIFLFDLFPTNYNQRNYYQKQIIIEDHIDLYKPTIISNASSPKKNLHIKEITVAIKEINYDYKVPFALFLSGYTCKEIAERLNISINETENRISMARYLLEEKLTKDR